MSRELSPDEVWDEVAQMIVDIILIRDKLEEYFFFDKVTQPEAFSFDVFHPHVPRKERCLCSFHLDIIACELPSIATELDTVALTDGHSNDFTQRACSDSHPYYSVHVIRNTMSLC